ncbi:MAG: EF-P beta-lysylation protein EpmB [Pseudomonadales bacterium]
MNIPVVEQHTWQWLLGNTLERLDELLDFVELTPAQLDLSEAASRQFALRVPLPYASLIEKGNPHDPLLLQVLPQRAEMQQVPGFVSDPLEEKQSNPVEGLIHKYRGRVLVILSSACAINCRYCFRRHFPYGENRTSGEHWQRILDYIRADESITEVIFSGGDPLATSDKRLAKMLDDLQGIAHLQRLRFHSRLPVVIPQRITDELCQILANCRLQKVLVVHANHAREFSPAVARALRNVAAVQCQVLNQAVLLKGINDDLEAQLALHQASFAAGALPYYLFVLDRVQGAAHFDVSDDEAVELLRQMQRELPGYLLPRLAREIPGKPSKTLLHI